MYVLSLSSLQTLTKCTQAAAIVTGIRKEIDLHINECKEFGLTREEMETYEESQGKPTYSCICLAVVDVS